MKPRLALVPLAFALSTLGLAGCFKVDPPPVWFCSRVEPSCPAGLVCNDQQCVANLPPDAALDAGRGDARPDLWAKPDAPIKPDLLSKPDTPHVLCSTLDDWICNWGSDWAELTCSNRLLLCTHDHIGWYCDCGIGKDVKPCWDIAPPIDLCQSAEDSFLQGCCRP